MMTNVKYLGNFVGNIRNTIFKKMARLVVSTFSSKYVLAYINTIVI